MKPVNIRLTMLLLLLWGARRGATTGPVTTRPASRHCAFHMAAQRRQEVNRPLWSPSSLWSSEEDSDKLPPIEIVGGGLAGLSVAYHLLQLESASPVKRLTSLTIVDKDMVSGGASAVAGGFLHPFSPRGKLLYLGWEGLSVANQMVDAAIAASDDNNDDDDASTIRLFSHLNRYVSTPREETEWQETARLYPDVCTWSHQQQQQQCLQLSGGCCVLQVPRYLAGLWRACLALAELQKVSCEWSTRATTMEPEKALRIWAAGAGMFLNNEDKKSENEAPIVDLKDVITLVRGQALEISVPSSLSQEGDEEWKPRLCGKYVYPTTTKLSEESTVWIVGATHEFGRDAWTKTQVWEDLQERTRDCTPAYVWDGRRPEDTKLVEGVRVQTQRGQFGRLPIVGQLSEREWILTGLSSRGLLYHGILGQLLARAIWNNQEEEEIFQHEALAWWKQTKRE